MSKTKRSFSPEFKSKVVLELLAGEQAVVQLATKYQITPNRLNQWKKKSLENASLAFDVGKATQGFRDEIKQFKKENDALAKKLGKTTIERDWAVGKRDLPLKVGQVIGFVLPWVTLPTFWPPCPVG